MRSTHRKWNYFDDILLILMLLPGIYAPHTGSENYFKRPKIHTPEMKPDNFTACTILNRAWIIENIYKTTTFTFK